MSIIGVEVEGVSIDDEVGGDRPTKLLSLSQDFLLISGICNCFYISYYSILFI